MARTKQVIRRSTGGYATRQSFALVVDQPPVPAIPTKTPRKTRSASKAAKKASAAKAAATKAAKKSAAEPPRLTIKVPPRHNSYCCVCTEGGELYLCHDCERVACNECVTLAPQALTLFLQDPDFTFICPQSHMDREAEKGQKKGDKSLATPYTGLLLRGASYPASKCGYATIRASTVRANYPRVNSTPLGIINIRLKAIDGKSDPAVLVHQYLEVYFQERPESLLYHLQEFDVKPGDAESLASHKAELDKVVEAMAGFGRVVVFVQTHSVPETGDLHTTKGVAVTADDFLKHMFGDVLPKFTAQIPSMLVFLTCGALLGNADSYRAIARLAKGKIFQNIIGFGAEKLIPHLATCLLEKLVCKHFIEGFSVERILPNLVREEDGLGPHTSVYHMAYEAATEFVWHQKDTRPFGNPLPPQCTRCRCLRTLSVKHDENMAEVRCKMCNFLVTTFTCQEDVFKTVKKTAACGWLTKSWWKRDSGAVMARGGV